MITTPTIVQRSSYSRGAFMSYLECELLLYFIIRGCRLASCVQDVQVRMGKVLIISPEKCTGCRTCEMACSFAKTNQFNPQNSAVSVFQYDDAMISVPVMCLQCEDPSCMKVCLVGAITKDENGTVLVNSNKCIGCKLCISACPFGNMSFNSENKTLVKCDLCNGSPSCAVFCPSGAIEFRDANPIELNKKKLVAEKFKAIFEEVDK